MGDQTRFESMTKDVIRVHQDPCALDGAAWNALLDRQSRPTPFMRWEYLAALHASGSAVPRTGWAPRFVTVHRGAKLVAAAPAYLKSHSYGEYAQLCSLIEYVQVAMTTCRKPHLLAKRVRQATSCPKTLLGHVQVTLFQSFM